MVIRKVTPNITTFSTPFWRFGHVKVGGRGTAGDTSPHHIFLGPWHEEHPNAKVLGPEGLPEKREKQKNEKVPFAVVFTAKDKETTKVDADFDSDFDYEFVDGHMNKELVFNYKPEGILIEADLIFNLPAVTKFPTLMLPPDSLRSVSSGSTIRCTQGAAMGQRRFIWIIPCHGDVMETSGKGIFQKIMEWHLEKKA
ncbi:hypothetical protein K402DRAFT_410899 [Aulographum hederae CBS 113979]|uniref:Uncharacterized protein n=1 Tax=Aulographum hederae CBS 113979 TaxID=1176131 RepID=A0A6G1HA43_9PEZI|nr:hypothetical protein K402DRAFT_410899 [Aulographum hederae CBS 113979]